mmetsp:Transcript_48536/g.90059  ORF Transcript_48536/g.90059 Transcript_48536/m.90059 type:complete len:235 (+) Transcript_48536:429-1133(+)
MTTAATTRPKIKTATPICFFETGTRTLQQGKMSSQPGEASLIASATGTLSGFTAIAVAVVKTTSVVGSPCSTSPCNLSSVSDDLSSGEVCGVDDEKGPERNAPHRRSFVPSACGSLLVTGTCSLVVSVPLLGCCVTMFERIEFSMKFLLSLSCICLSVSLADDAEALSPVIRGLERRSILVFAVSTSRDFCSSATISGGDGARAAALLDLMAAVRARIFFFASIIAGWDEISRS